MTYRIEEPTLWDESGMSSARAQAHLLQQVAGGPPGYRLRRIILTNFWLYEHQEFEIPHGRIFLAGDNRSGKSTVLTAAITLALDGDYRPERIDTFGKREKRIDYYILGSTESNTPFTRDSRTSYIGLEFEWCDMTRPPFASELRTRWERGEYQQARFLTIGVAFHGNRNNASPITALRFLITDGKRLEYDIPTLVEGKDGLRACDLKAFKKTLTEHGQVFETQHEYEQKVSQYLFNFTNVSDFRRLIRQLLYLRQPNLNSVLSLESVRTFLDQSLPSVPTDLIQHAATTLELMESLQEEIGRRKKAYGAVEKLHLAQQTLAVAKARTAACEYAYAQLQATAAQNDVVRLKRNITRAENDLERNQTRINDLEREQEELSGAISALEGSQGLQAARRISQARITAADCERDFGEKCLIFQDATTRREQIEQDIETHSAEFKQGHQQSEQLLIMMHRLASHEASWQIAADQLAEALDRMRQFSLSASTPNLQTSISSLLGIPLQERLSWLRALQQLHREIAQANTQLQTYQQQETNAYDELDKVTRQFDSEREKMYAAQQDLFDSLDLLLDGSIWSTDFTDLHEKSVIYWNKALPPQEAVTQIGTLVQTYEHAIGRIIEAIKISLYRVQQNLASARQRQGEKNGAVRQARVAYERKLQEPEYTPHRSEHRRKARECLKAKGITAFPLYMLIDFTSNIDSQSPLAGGIEYFLEDAGLLDALVVLDMNADAADALLAEEGLSDCLLDVQHLAGNQGHQSITTLPPEAKVLQIDPAVYDSLKGTNWEEIIYALLNILESTVYPSLLYRATSGQSMQWKHGLLTGKVGRGSAHCIGKATRIREQQAEQQRLYLQWEALEHELKKINDEVEEAEQQQQQQEALRERMSNILKESKIDSQYAILQGILTTLQQVDTQYKKARSEAQAMRQHITNLKTRLEREVGEVQFFASDAGKVEQAYEATNKLVSEQKTLSSYGKQLLTVWQIYKQADKQIGQVKNAEIRAEGAKRKAELTLTQARAELNMLEKMLRETEQGDLNTLLSQLQKLQTRQSELPAELQKIRDQRAKIESGLDTNRTDYSKAQEAQGNVHRQCNDAYDHFSALLHSYPVEMLADAQQQMSTKTSLEVAQNLLIQPLEPQTDAYPVHKSELEKRERSAQGALYQAFSEVINLLHEYGPHIDEQGLIRFLNAEQANACELLTSLGEEIQHHEQLLEAREQELFQNFLLEEMADTVGRHIADAEAWVEKMNSVLGQSPLVGEYYSLKWVYKQPDRNHSSNALAQYHNLLRRQIQTFKQGEIDVLVHAFRQEVNALRAQQLATSDTTFAEALAQIFDYRSWFQFEIYITRNDGTQQHLTNRFFKKGSGAEQYVTLYVPFFAALSALYESAGRGAPRLIALDEAFDKVSVENTRNLLNFLSSQHFQWIMTGPRVTGEGTEIPACVKYTMFCQKEQELAAGFPSFWSADVSLLGN